MTELTANRTLVKSPPELWAECSDAASLARHLGQFGEIKITKLEPETAVAWEGERASGTVRLEPSGWGTKVLLTARVGAPVIEAEAEAPPAVEEPSVQAPPVQPERRPGLFARLFALWRRPVESQSVMEEPPPQEEAQPESEEEPPPSEDTRFPEAEAALTAALDSLGQAHHRPFSRA
jgi:hypothetical protein